jgi:hypothetical protein
MSNVFNKLYATNGQLFLKAVAINGTTVTNGNYLNLSKHELRSYESEKVNLDFVQTVGYEIIAREGEDFIVIKDFNCKK